MVSNRPFILIWMTMSPDESIASISSALCEPSLPTRLATPLLTALQYNFLLNWVFPSESPFFILHALDTLTLACVRQWMGLCVRESLLSSQSEQET